MSSQRSGTKFAPAIATVIALGAAACVPLKGLPVQVGTPDPGAATQAQRSPGGAAGPGLAASPRPASAAPVSLVQPGFLTPPPTQAPASAAPTPAPTPLPPAPTGLTQAHEALKPILQKKLLNIAQVGFSQGQAGLIANNGGSLLSNNSAGIISNNGGGLIGNNGGGYRVMQSVEAISFEALAGEELAFDHIWPDNRRYRVFRPAGTTDYATTRQVTTNPAGAPVKEVFRKVSELTASGAMKVFEEGQMLQADDGRVLARFGYAATNGDDGTIANLSVLPNSSRWKDDVGGIHIEVSALALNYAANSGSFTYGYPRLNQVETGTLNHLRKDADGRVTLNLTEPFEKNDGESRMESSAGALLYKRKVALVGGQRVSSFDLGDGIVVRLDGRSGADEIGELLVEGVREAYVRLERRADASRIFVVTFDEDKTHPLVIGYGIVDAAAAPKPSPLPPAWMVSTVAGAAEAGLRDGPGAQARFKSLMAIAASRVTPNRFYAADMGNHAIRTLDVAADGSVTVGTYAGTGTAYAAADGPVEGPRLEATFSSPFGLAVDTDDTLYVADSQGHRIRKIAPDGTVSTYAGSGKAGFLNGVGPAAWFFVPAGLALGADKTLYVAEFGGRMIRKIAADGTVTTLAGTFNQSGTTDGTGAAARFGRPNALALDAGGNVIVADFETHRLRRVTPEGVVTTVAGGQPASRFAWDGSALDIGLAGPRALAYDASGQLFVGATNVRQWRDDGRLTSYAGLHITGHVDGDHTIAYFTNIQGLAFGAKNVLYVSDGTRVRAIAPPAP
jgi:sugar lactone lactonase YvrE